MAIKTETMTNFEMAEGLVGKSVDIKKFTLKSIKQCLLSNQMPNRRQMTHGERRAMLELSNWLTDNIALGDIACPASKLRL